MRVQVPVQALQLGMYVDELDRPWEGTPFLFQGFPIRTRQELDQLKNLCSYVYVYQQESDLPSQSCPRPEVSHRFQTSGININNHLKANHGKQDHHRLVADLQFIKKTYDQSYRYIMQTLNDVRLGRSINVEGAKSVVSSMTAGIIQNENTLVLLSQLKQHDEYTVRHSLNVCILALLLAKHLGIGECEMQVLGLGALLHDIGKMRLPIEILNKPGTLSDPEFALVRQHAEMGYELLQLREGLPMAALDVVRSHHERIDGTGYLRGLKGEEIGLFPRIVSVVDVYDAITTNRCYHNGISPHEAIRLMYEKESGSFPSELLERFIQCLSIFPIGSVVELDSGEIGIVMNVNRSRHLLPVVLLVLSRDKVPYYPRKICNLEAVTERGEEQRIKRILESDAYGINVARILFEEGDFSSLELS